MAYQHGDNVDYDPQADSDHDWEVVERIFPDRPPILIRENFSSSEAGAPFNDPHPVAPTHVMGVNVKGLHLTHGHDHGLSSYPSSSADSVRAPEGPEIRDPANRFLPIAPEMGLNEPRHRRRASVDEAHSRASFSLREWAKNLPAHERSRSFDEQLGGGDGNCCQQGGWLPLGTHIVGPGPGPAAVADSGRATKGKSSGSASVLHGSVYSGVSSGCRSSNLESLVSGMGTWIGESALGGWPDYLDEEAFQEDYD